MTGRLILITGAQAAGKTTIGDALARSLSKAVHIDGDVIQGFVKSGAIGMDLPPPPGAMEQLYLRYRGSIAVANLYRDNGFDAIITDNMFGRTLADVVAMGHAAGDVHVIVLDPGIAVVERRDRDRDKASYTATVTAKSLIDSLRTETARIGLWHDNSGETVAETTSLLLDELGAALVPRDCG